MKAPGPLLASDEIPTDGYTELAPQWLDIAIREIRRVAARAIATNRSVVRLRTQHLARQILASIEADDLAVPSVDYFGPGGLCFAWSRGERSIEILVTRDGSIAIKKRLDGAITFYVHRSTARDVVPLVRRAIDWCFRGYASTVSADVDSIINKGMSK